MAALDEAGDRIEHSPAAGLPAPPPYPALAKAGRAWIKVGRYWAAYNTAQPPVIVAMFYETADNPLSNRHWDVSVTRSNSRSTRHSKNARPQREQFWPSQRKWS